MKSLFTKVFAIFMVFMLMVNVNVIETRAEGLVNPQLTVEGSTNLNNDEILITDDAKLSDADIEKETLESEINTYSNNQPPVAGLEYVILNPESLINGNITTNTQIAWLWSYNGVDFTYDPDGDAIVNMSIGGIPANSIIGSITGGIGFATQITTPGQYVMTFQVEDARGAVSNILQFIINVEPANGNTRPVCNIVYTPKSVLTNQLMMISWAKSYDNDPGDSVKNIRGLVYKNGVKTDLSAYVNQEGATELTAKFSDSGTYEIWLSVCDTRGAWSNWVIITLNVQQPKLSNVSINTITEGTVPSGEWWVDETKARAFVNKYELRPSDSNVELVLQEAGSNYFPSELPSEMLFPNLDFSGDVKDENGLPISNAEVKIQIPMTKGNGIIDYVKTDANGHFVYNISDEEFWLMSGFYDDKEIDWLALGDISGDFTQYAHYSFAHGTLFVHPTTVTISCGGSRYTKDVTLKVGYSRNPIIGDWFIYNGHWDSY